jgi:hypothetical protein
MATCRYIYMGEQRGNSRSEARKSQDEKMDVVVNMVRLDMDVGHVCKCWKYGLR